MSVNMFNTCCLCILIWINAFTRDAVHATPPVFDKSPIFPLRLSVGQDADLNFKFRAMTLSINSCLIYQVKENTTGSIKRLTCLAPQSRKIQLTPDEEFCRCFVSLKKLDMILTLTLQLHATKENDGLWGLTITNDKGNDTTQFQLYVKTDFPAMRSENTTTTVEEDSPLNEFIPIRLSSNSRSTMENALQKDFPAMRSEKNNTTLEEDSIPNALTTQPTLSSHSTTAKENALQKSNASTIGAILTCVLVLIIITTGLLMSLYICKQRFKRAQSQG